MTDNTMMHDPPTPRLDDGFEHYYDLHPTQEDLMGESAAQANLIATS
ncbi:MAG: hypothetical protein MI924_14185 [Chloroflexales bacterium]|nr:hypothetical protein [Chloroflexales bacterium]